jgi:hypothetical protein
LKRRNTMAAQAKAGDMAKGGGDQKSDQRVLKNPVIRRR